MQLGLHDIVGQHRVEHLALQRDSVVHQHHIVVLNILSYLQNRWVFVDWFEDINILQRLFTVVRNSNIKRLMGFYGEA